MRSSSRKVLVFLNWLLLPILAAAAWIVGSVTLWALSVTEPFFIIRAVVIVALPAVDLGCLVLAGGFGLRSEPPDQSKQWLLLVPGATVALVLLSIAAQLCFA